MQDDDFRSTASLETLHFRAALLKNLRAFFDTRGFLEVCTPALSRDTVIDRHLDPLRVTLFDEPRQPDRGRLAFLQTSPEFHMKRLLAGGARAIYQVCQVFRGGESGPGHNVEFTMVEWYHVDEGMAEGMQRLSALCETLLDCEPAECLTYAAAFQRQVGLDPHLASLADLRAVARQLGRPAAADDRDDLLHFLHAAAVQPRLGLTIPTILFDFPCGQSALARVRAGNPPVAERFELYYHGWEIANGYHELTDPDELARRNRAVNRDRLRDGKPPLPEKSRLLSALRHGLPRCTGVALGFDRLVMVGAGLDSLRQVLTFPENFA